MRIDTLSTRCDNDVIMISTLLSSTVTELEVDGSTNTGICYVESAVLILALLYIATSDH